MHEPFRVGFRVWASYFKSILKMLWGEVGLSLHPGPSRAVYAYKP